MDNEIEKVNKMSENKEEDSNLCSCIYDVLINENKECMLELDDKKYNPRDLDYVKDCVNINLDHGKERMSETYERICLLTNDHLNIDCEIYFRVFRILLKYDIYLDLNQLRKTTNITVWSNGKSDPTLSDFLTYWKGVNIGHYKCPPSIAIIADYIIDSEINKNHAEPDIFISNIYKCEKEVVI